MPNINGISYPDPQTKLTRLQFRSRFTSSEKAVIYSAADASISVKIWLDDLAVAEFIDLSDPSTIAAVQGLEAAGLISAGRATEILTP
jgi:hypothetical protein